MLSLWLYRALIHLALPLVAPALLITDRLAGKSRPAFARRIWWRPPPTRPGGLWIQAVSVGEVELARRLVVELEQRTGELPSLLTATTATGLALAHSRFADRVPVAPCPMDLPLAVNRLFRAVEPRALVLVETELWPEMMYQAARRGVPVAVVNARLSAASFRSYRRWRRLLKPLLDPISLVAARADGDAARFAALGVAADRIRVTGNIKYDLSPAAAPLPWAGALRSLAGDRPVMVAGSTMEGEEEVVLDALDELARSAVRPFLILAPRHPERCDRVAGLLAARGFATVRRSALAEQPAAADVVLMDTIGELARAYGLARLAFVGGSLAATGGHNPLEPAAWGVPVLTGPTVHNFSEVYAEMLAAGAAHTVHDAVELAARVAEWLRDPAAARRAGEAGRAVVEANRGATARTVDALLAVAPPRHGLAG